LVISREKTEGLKEEFINPIEGWKFHQDSFECPEKELEFWPQTGLEPVFREFYNSQKELVAPLMTCLLEYFKLDPKLHNPDNYFNTIRLNYYAPLNPEELSSRSPRLFPHQDLGMMTILPAPSSEGLQVLGDDLKWIRINAPKNSLIVNVGKFLQRMTNDIIPAAVHRVIKPTPSQNFARVSFPFQFNLKEDVMLEVLPLGDVKYQPIRGIDFLIQNSKQYFGDKLDDLIEESEKDKKK